jgi:threonine synthase
VRFYSTNRSAPDVTLREALLQGQAPDRGLYMPREVPRVDRDTLESWRTLDYPDLAFEVLSRYTTGEFPDDVVRALAHDAYTYPVPIEPVFDRHHLLRLDQGPTASFKDFAARMMARLISYILSEEDRRLVILTATSGDTGSAVAHAFHGLPNVQVCVLFPVKEVSDRQRRQMTTLAGNVATLGIDGKFDDAQAMVKRAFADPDLAGIPLSSANSINIGRLLPQSVYYVWAWLRVSKPGEEIVICVPSGNFGNMMGGMLAWRMGLPVRKMLIATNENDEFPTYLETGDYHKIEPSINALSNAMNVGHPSNLARLVALYGGWMRETGKVEQPPDLEAMRRDLWAVAINDEWTRRTIREAYQEHGVLLEPHGAVGWAALTHWLKQGHSATATVTLETAHPAKFPEQIVDLLDFDPNLPPALEGLDEKPEHWKPMNAEYERFKSFLKATYPTAG